MWRRQACIFVIGFAATAAKAGYVGDGSGYAYYVHTTGVVLSTQYHPIGAFSSLSISLNLFGLQSIRLKDLKITGSVPVDFGLDSINNGSIEANGGNLSLSNANQSFAGIFLTGNIQIQNGGAQLFLGPETVVQRSLVIDSGTPGALELDRGTLSLTFTGGVLYPTLTSLMGATSFSIDLSTKPMLMEFSDLGTKTVIATTDRDGSGFDPDGAELNVPLRFVSSLDLAGIVFTTTTSGQLHLGSSVFVGGFPFPEMGSLGFSFLAMAALSGVAAIRLSRSESKSGDAE